MNFEEEILKECTELAENEKHELGDCWYEEYSSSAIFGLIMLYKQTKKELNNLKEIEKAHQEENGKLRVELEQEKSKIEALEKQHEYDMEMIDEVKGQANEWINLLEQEKEKNEELEIELAVRDNIKVDKLVEKYRYYRKLADSYQANCISKNKIKEKIEELEKEQKEYEESQEWEIQDDYVAKIMILEELLGDWQ